jgi:bacillithiol synthase
LQELKTILGDTPAALALFEQLEKSYAGPKNFAEATQALLHEFMGDFGLVVLNMNSPLLKRYFIPIMREELLEESSLSLVNETIGQLKAAGFKSQAPPREINLFYMKAGMRERIVRENGFFKVLNTDLVFSTAEIQVELEAHPEHFSPNVVLRPLFQEQFYQTSPTLAAGGNWRTGWKERRNSVILRYHSPCWLEGTPSFGLTRML